jgi:hypothetical protein
MEKITVNRWDDMKYKVTTIKEGTPDDLFISCISYEPRTRGIFKKLDKSYKADTGLFITNEQFEKFSKVRENKKEIKNILERRAFFNNLNNLSSSIDNPIKIIIEIDKIIKNRLADKQRITITFDITTFPRGELLTIIYYLRHLTIIDTIRILYISPKRYGDWLSEGYRYSMIPPFFEGPPTFEKKTAILILAGFEYDRVVSLIDDVEPSALILGRPHPGTSKEFRDADEDIITKLKRTRRFTKEIYDIPANDPFLCRDSLKEIIQKNSQSYDFFVVPMGPKIEVLGTYLAYEENPNFRIIYPVPLIYNVVNYSSGCRDVYEVLLKSDEIAKKQSETV